MRVLNSLDIESVSGGGAAEEIFKWVLGEIAGAILKAGASLIGVAGSNANENDNGGTSYGIGPCSTLGCSIGGLFPNKVPPLMFFASVFERTNGSQPTADDWRAALTEYQKWTPEQEATRQEA